MNGLELLVPVQLVLVFISLHSVDLLRRKLNSFARVGVRGGRLIRESVYIYVYICMNKMG